VLLFLNFVSVDLHTEQCFIYLQRLAKSVSGEEVVTGKMHDWASVDDIRSWWEVINQVQELLGTFMTENKDLEPCTHTPML